MRMDFPETSFFIRTPKPRPYFGSVAAFLWGDDADFDSEGDCLFSNDRNWTELTATKRPDYEERVDVDPICAEPLTLVVRSEMPELSARTAYFLARYTDGLVAESLESEFLPWRVLESRLGDFDFESLFRRVANKTAPRGTDNSSPW